MVSSEKNDKIIQLKSGCEFQLLVNEPDDKINLQLLEGNAEIFGTELQINKTYEFAYFSSVSVFSWHGCVLRLWSREPDKSNYEIRQSTQIPKMREIHEEIEQIRLNADRNNTEIPIALVTGPTDVGKSTLCRFLLNYAVRHGRRPMFIDFDVGQSSLSITGTFSVLSVQEPSDVNGKFNEQLISVYYFGYKSPGHNMTLYQLLLQQIGRALRTRLQQQHQHEKSSGVLIDTCGWVEGGGYNLIREIIDVLRVNMVLVLKEKPLLYKLQNHLQRSTKIMFIEKFHDVVTRNRSIRIDNRNNSVREYFYGTSGQIKPYTFKVNFSELQIFKVPPSSELKSCPSKVIPVYIEPDILFQVFGLSYAEQIENIPLTSVYGFICIIELDMDSEVATILSPRPGPLPASYLLMGDVTLSPDDMIS